VRYTYAYFMKPDAARVRATAPAHAAYWRRLELRGYQGGPFVDRSGGLIMFEHDSEHEARRIAERDPFRIEGLVEAHWLKAWAPD
jgi:uncharacterized protein YciI